MTVDELRELLEDYDGGTEVRIMSQQAWPFENAIYGVTASSEFGPEDQDDEETEQREDVVYLVEGSQLGYGDKDAWDAARR